MACPYFEPALPLNVAPGQGWRVPLGELHDGVCGVSAQRPPDEALREHCNLGYARGKCGCFPLPEGPDAVRFGIASDDGARIDLHCVVERDYHPFAYYKLEYDIAAAALHRPCDNAALGRQALAYLSAYLRRKRS